jgi:hypothetical protein
MAHRPFVLMFMSMPISRLMDILPARFMSSLNRRLA